MGAGRTTRRALFVVVAVAPFQMAAARGRGGGSRGARGRSGAGGRGIILMGLVFGGGLIACLMHVAFAARRERKQWDSEPPTPVQRHRPRGNTKAIRKAIDRHNRRIQRRSD